MTAPEPSMEKPAVRLPNGTTLHLDSRHGLNDAGFAIAEIFGDQVYHRPGFELHPGDTIVDIGAHVGVFAHWAAPQIPQGRMICVEPTSAANRLEHSLAQNGLTNVRLLRCAAGAPSSTLEMSDHPQFAVLNRSSEFPLSLCIRLMQALIQRKHGRIPAQSCSVPCRSLEEIMASESVDQCDLLKIDCEGGEFTLLDHTSRAVLRRCRRIMMEFHLFHPTHSLRRLRDRLEADGFAVHVQKPWLQHLLHRTGMLWATRID